MIALIHWFGNMFTQEVKVSEETLARLNAELSLPDEVPAMPWRVVRYGQSARDAYKKPFRG